MHHIFSISTLKINWKNTYIFRIELLWIQCARGKNSGMWPVRHLENQFVLLLVIKVCLHNVEVLLMTEYKLSILNPKACLWSSPLTVERLYKHLYDSTFIEEPSVRTNLFLENHVFVNLLRCCNVFFSYHRTSEPFNLLICKWSK